MPPKKKASSRSAARKAPARARAKKATKTVARKPAARKPAARKPERKPAARKATARKAAARKAPARKTEPTSEEIPFRDFFGGARAEAERDAEAGDAPRGDAPPVSHFQPGFAPECMACPIGLVFYAMKNTQPEVMEHVMRAGFELFQALRALMEQYNQRWEHAQSLEHIPIG